MEKSREYIENMFTQIAPEYDRMNFVIGFGLGSIWRKKVAKKLTHAELILDLCAGTGDMAKTIFSQKDFKGKIVLIDRNWEMLKIAQKKLSTYHNRFFIVVADVENLPFKENCFGGMSLGYALRHILNFSSFLSGVKKCLKIDSSAYLLDLARPKNYLLRQSYLFYLNKIMIWWLSLFTQNGKYYKFLYFSLNLFIPPDEVIGNAKSVGFKQSEYKNLCGGMAAIYCLNK
jgi:demethylmenaquinone methyltransferase/2-methoxy-6-polyprenyl-1,4-benzoquinol methylase